MQQLYDEHEIILMAIDRLRNLIEPRDLASRAEELRALLLFFRGYADGYHHQKEEAILFPILIEANPGIEGLIGSLEDHHAQFRESLATAEAAMNVMDWDTASATFDKYAFDLLDHISAENDELFVAADDLLSDGEKERIYYQFIDADRELGIEQKQLLEGVVNGG